MAISNYEYRALAIGRSKVLSHTDQVEVDGYFVDRVEIGAKVVFLEKRKSTNGERQYMEDYASAKFTERGNTVVTRKGKTLFTINRQAKTEGGYKFGDKLWVLTAKHYEYPHTYYTVDASTIGSNK